MRAAIALLALAACTEAKPGQRTASSRGAPAGGRVALQEMHVQISNTLATPMTATALVGGQARALGTVEAKQQGSFMVQAPPGVDIRVVANDRANKHRVQATLMGADSVLHFVIR